MANNVLVELFRHNTWANERMLDVCAELDDRVLDATGDGVYGSIRDTLVHIFGAQGRYVHRMAGEPPLPMVSEREPFPSFETLRESARASSRAFEELAARAETIETLRGEYGGRPYELEPEVLFTQAINHATEHRAHINTILTQAGVEPAQLDSWAWNDLGRP